MHEGQGKSGKRFLPWEKENELCEGALRLRMVEFFITGNNCLIFFSPGNPACLTHCTDSDESLVTLTKISTWEVVLNTARIRNFIPVLQLSNTTDIPKMNYHRKCYQIFTMKCVLQQIEKETTKRNEEIRKGEERLRLLLQEADTFETEEDKPKREGSSNSTLLPNKCLFCGKEKVYIKRKAEKLTKCCGKRVEQTIEKAATEKNDYHMLSFLTTTDLIAAEAKYHRSCYSNYTPKVKKTAVSKTEESDKLDYKRFELEAYCLVVEHCHHAIEEKKVLRFQDLVFIMKEYLEKNKQELKQSTKRHLRRNLEKSFKDNLKFLMVHELYVYPAILTVEEAVKNLIEKQNGGDEVFLLTRAAACIRNEIKEMDDNIPWPPQPEDLKPDKFRMPDTLGHFLTTLSSPMTSGRAERLKLSIAQDIVYNLTKGRIKTLKSILLPSIIKTLTNNAEVINILNRLGDGVSYSILSELNTENAFKIEEQQLEDNLILPLDCQKEKFTIYVADNIDWNEETLSGSYSYFEMN